MLKHFKQLLPIYILVYGSCMKTTYNIYEMALLMRMITHPLNNHDCITCITGARGMGKSVLGMRLTGLLTPNYFTHETMDYNNIYQPSDLSKKMDECPDNTAFLVDEAINVLFKRDFAKKKQKTNIKIFNTHRDKRLIILLLVPNFFDIDSSVRNSLIIKFWIHVYSRGKAWIFTHENNPATDDPWCRSNIFYNHLRGRIYKAQNYIGNLQFPNVKDEHYKIYQKIKKDKRLDDDEDNEPKLTNNMIVKWLANRNPKLSKAEIGRRLDIKATHVSTALND